MTALTRRPATALAPFVHSLGYYEGDEPAARERVLPTAAVQLLVNLDEDEFRTYDGPDGAVRRIRGAAVQGPHSRPSIIDTEQQRRIVVIGFRDGGIAPFLPLPLGELGDQLVELADLWGGAAGVLRERLLAAPDREAALRVVESTLLEQVTDVPDRGMAVAASALEDGVPVGEVTDRLGLTSKRLLRRFCDQVGLPPKRFARVRRFQRALAAIPHDRPVDWAELATSCGYFDQSHLIRDFHEFAGVSPTAYRPRTPLERNHVPVES